MTQKMAYLADIRSCSQQTNYPHNLLFAATSNSPSCAAFLVRLLRPVYKHVVSPLASRGGVAAMIRWTLDV